MTASAPSQDRGRRRKEALLDAAVALMEDGGPARVTHRAVAERAGLPLSATTYYYRSREDLVVQAFARLVDRDLAAVRERALAAPGTAPASGAAEAGPAASRAHRFPAAGTADAVAAAVVAALAPPDQAARGRHLALWELYLRVGREPALRYLARAWTDGCQEIVADVLARAGRPHSPEDARLVLATAERLVVEDLVETRPGAADTAVAAVARLITLLSADRS